MSLKERFPSFEVAAAVSVDAASVLLNDSLDLFKKNERYIMEDLQGEHTSISAKARIGSEIGL